MGIINNLFNKKQKRGIVFVGNNFCEELITSGQYTSLANRPEIVAGVREIADLISGMTIHLMANTENGDKRILNELSRKIDISPYSCMTRKTWMDFIIMNLLLYGKGNSVVLPITRDGLISELKPIHASQVSFEETSTGYNVRIGNKYYSHDEVLHFIFNSDKNYPWKGQGLQACLKDVAENLQQASTTTKEFMSSKWKPSIIVKVDAAIDEFASPEGRQKLIDEYLKTNKAGEPWMIPMDQFQIEQIKPLSLNDLAINSSIELDKKTVAAIIGVPPFVLGVGTYSDAEWNNFISTKIRPLAKGIEQELTRKLIVSPKMYFRFNMASLYSYDLRTMADVYKELYDRGIADGNEVRDKVYLPPREGLDQLLVLENYIPISKVGDQKKLEE